jgi:hypothetical protein
MDAFLPKKTGGAKLRSFAEFRHVERRNVEIQSLDLKM